MKLKEITKLLSATVLCGGGLPDEEYHAAVASDLMSDVLTIDGEPLLLTGLCNVQTLRTCEMLGLRVVVLVRGKKPTDDMLALASENDVTLLGTPLSMYHACGRLFEAGLKPGK